MEVKAVATLLDSVTGMEHAPLLLFLLTRAAGMPMRVPISKLCDAGQQGGSFTAVQTSSLDLQRPASNEPLEVVPVASKDTLPPQPAEKPQSHREENEKKPTKAMEVQEAFLDSDIFGGKFASSAFLLV